MSNVDTYRGIFKIAVGLEILSFDSYDHDAHGHQIYFVFGNSK